MDYPQYDPGLDTPPLDDAELDALDDLLHSLPGEAVMNIEALDGFLTALLVGPPVLQRLRTADWLPLAWGGDGVAAGQAGQPSHGGHRDGAQGGVASSAPFASQKQRKRATLLVLRHLHGIQRQLQGPPEGWEPVFSIAESDDREWVDAEDWCAGFLQATALDSAAWGALFDDARLGPLLLPVALLGSDEAGLTPEDRARLADPAERDALSRAVVDAVLALHGQRGGQRGGHSVA